MQKLDKKLKNKWIKSLRSGKFKQGREYLKQEDGKGGYCYCCLGVLGELQGCIMPQGAGYLTASKNSTPVKNLSGIPKILRGFKQGSIAITLSSLNDEQLYNFDQIANWIDKNL